MLSLKIDQLQADRYAEKMWQYVHKKLKRIIKDQGLYGFKNKTKYKKISLTTNELSFLKSINIETKLKEILSGETKKLCDFIDDFESKNPNLRDSSNELNRALYNVFVSRGYESKNFDGLKFVNDIGLQTCPYCNRAYIQSVSKGGVVRPQIDHFYPKSKYPYLGMSFYNLIPSCSVCNGTTAKGERDSYNDQLVSPYEINNNDFKFSFDPITTKDFRVKFNKKVDSNDIYFKLEEFYKYHGDIVHELYVKIKQENTKEHFDLLRNSLRGIGLDEGEIYRFITCGYLDDEDLHKRPLSKLIKDISEELDLI